MPRVWKNSESEKRRLLDRGYDVELVRMEQMTIKQQLQQIRKTSMLISLHGAGLTWLLFLPPGATIVEAVPISHLKRNTFKTASTWRPDINYKQIHTTLIGNDEYETDIIKSLY